MIHSDQNKKKKEKNIEIDTNKPNRVEQDKNKRKLTKPIVKPVEPNHPRPVPKEEPILPKRKII